MGKLGWALGYLFGLFGGIALLLLYKDKESKFHGWQSIIFGAAVFAIYIVLTITIVGIILVPLVGLAAFALVLWMMYRALQGERVELPYITPWAEKMSAK